MDATPMPYTTITSSDALSNVWTRLMGEGGFGRRSLWVIFFDSAKRLQTIVMPIEDISARPEHGTLAALASVLTRSLDEQSLGSTAFLLSRPGPPQMTEDDRAWARALLALDDERLRYWPVHLATRDRVRVFAPDDLVGAA